MAVALPYHYNFNSAGTLEEGATHSLHFLVNSGGKLIMEGGVGKTIHGDLPPTDKWFKAYAAQANADYGKKPQNLWRVYTKDQFSGPLQSELKMTMDAYHSAPHYGDQDASDGLLLFARMSSDGFEGYYFGPRQDGKVNFKKKLRNASGTAKWTYYPIPNGTKSGFLPGTYTQGAHLIPTGRQFTIRCQVTDEGENVRLRGWIDGVLQIDCIDTPALGGRVIRSGHFGWRTDFADVTVEDFRLSVPGTAEPAPEKTYADGLVEGEKKGRGDMKAEALAAITKIP